MAARKHHYVPVFYQRGFSDPDGLLWRYDRNSGEYKQLPPKVNCREEDLYAVQRSDGTWDRRIETDVLRHIDEAAAKVIRNLTTDSKPNRMEIRHLVAFIGLQHTRLPSFGKAVAKIVETEGDQWLRMQFRTRERAEQAFARYERKTGKKLASNAAYMVEAVLNKRIKAHSKKGNFIRSMFDIANSLGLWLEESEWTILVAPSQSGFVVCDHPFTILPPKGSTLEGVGWGVPGSTCYFPLNHRLCLEAHHGDYGFRFTQVDSRHVRRINLNVAANSDRFVMASNLDHLRAVVKKSGCEDRQRGERYSVEVFEPDANKIFTKFVSLPGRYFY
jgi:Protein of unknown function (DUF4238)